MIELLLIASTVLLLVAVPVEKARDQIAASRFLELRGADAWREALRPRG